MSPSVVVALAGFALTLLATLAGFVWALIKFGVQIGQVLGAQKELNAKLGVLDQIPPVIVRLGMVEEAVRKAVSDISSLREHGAEMRGRLNSYTDEG